MFIKRYCLLLDSKHDLNMEPAKGGRKKKGRKYKHKGVKWSDRGKDIKEKREKEGSM